MKKVILDENLPQPLRHHLSGFDVVTVQYRGWSGIQNGELIALIDRKFDVFLTAELTLPAGFVEPKHCIVELPLVCRRDIPQFVGAIRSAIISAKPGDYIQIKPDQGGAGNWPPPL